MRIKVPRYTLGMNQIRIKADDIPLIAGYDYNEVDATHVDVHYDWFELIVEVITIVRTKTGWQISKTTKEYERCE